MATAAMLELTGETLVEELILQGQHAERRGLSVTEFIAVLCGGLGAVAAALNVPRANVLAALNVPRANVLAALNSVFDDIEAGA